MEQASQWIAPVATTIAAMMTASNGGARLTGYGFLVFAIGSIAWTIYGWGTGQNNLVIQNLILLVINLVGVWRWLGLSARYKEGADAATAAAGDKLLAASTLVDLPAVDLRGQSVGTIVDAMMSSQSGRIVYAMLSHGGIGGVGEKMIAVPWRELELAPDQVRVRTSPDRLDRAEGIDRDDWPVYAPPDWDRPVK